MVSLKPAAVAKYERKGKIKETERSRDRESDVDKELNRGAWIDKGVCMSVCRRKGDSRKTENK